MHTKYFGVIAVKFSQAPKHYHFISHVHVLEVNNPNSYTSPGELFVKDAVIKLIEADVPFYTMKWNYNTSSWNPGSKISVVETDNIKYLKSSSDTTETDHLVNLLEINHFI